ncbi:MAG: glycosyltransferase [Rhodospirillaceae bacterium]|nr:glycosyltransferase [Rhodospirillaceae bacterium]
MPPRLLFLDILAPQPDRHASSVRSAQLVELMAERGYAVDFAPLVPPQAREQAALIRALGATPLPWCDEDKRRAFLAEHACDYDVIYLAWTNVARRFIDAARAGAPGARIVFDTHDVNHVREYREARTSGNQNTLRRALRTRADEARAMGVADVTLAITEADAETLRKLVPTARVAVVTMWWQPAEPPPRAPGAPRLLYVGHYGAAHNYDAALHLAQDILPRIRAVVPEADLTLAGSDPPEAIAALAGPGVSVSGWQADLAPLYAAAGVFVAPLRFGSGLKGKMLQAMAHAMPIVASAVAAEGIGLADGIDYLAADSAEAVSAAVLRLIADPGLAQRLGAAARRRLVERYGRAAVAAQLDAALDMVLAHPVD